MSSVPMEHLQLLLTILNHWCRGVSSQLGLARRPQRLPEQMPNPPHLAASDVEEQWIFSESLLDLGLSLKV